MWHEELTPGTSWTSLWWGYVRCGCGGIRRVQEPCPACGMEPYDTSPTVLTTPSGEEFEMSATFMGAEERIEDYEFLALMEREWSRPPGEAGNHFTSGMSSRGTVVILYWTYFETRMDRLVRLGLKNLPDPVQADLRRRYDSVTAHMGSLYQILFGTKYQHDLTEVGAAHIGGHLVRVQESRNKFIHGDPKALSDRLVEDVVRLLKDEHEAWIRVFNRRIAIGLGRPG
jgi:hypothetical protein